MKINTLSRRQNLLAPLSFQNHMVAPNHNLKIEQKSSEAFIALSISKVV